MVIRTYDEGLTCPHCETPLSDDPDHDVGRCPEIAELADFFADLEAQTAGTNPYQYAGTGVPAPARSDQ